MAKQFEKEIFELSTRELQEEILTCARINQKSLKRIDTSTSYLFWLCFLVLVVAIIRSFM